MFNEIWWKFIFILESWVNMVCEVKGFKEGDFIMIKSYKYDGSLYWIWCDIMVFKISENVLIGCNDYILVIEDDGCWWVMWEFVIVYFYKYYWFNIVVMICDNGVLYYCNLVLLYVLDKEVLKYIDYDLDVKVFFDGEWWLLDVDEYEEYGV